MQQGDALKDSDALFSSFLERKGHVKGKIRHILLQLLVPNFVLTYGPKKPRDFTALTTNKQSRTTKNAENHCFIYMVRPQEKKI